MPGSPGTGVDAVAELAARLRHGGTSVLADVLCAHARRVRQTREALWWSWNGSDATEDLVVAVLEALLALEQIRLELGTRSGNDFPLLLARLLPLEGLLGQAAGLSLAVHRDAWLTAKEERSAPVPDRPFVPRVLTETDG